MLDEISSAITVARVIVALIGLVSTVALFWLARKPHLVVSAYAAPDGSPWGSDGPGAEIRVTVQNQSDSEILGRIALEVCLASGTVVSVASLCGLASSTATVDESGKLEIELAGDLRPLATVTFLIATSGAGSGTGSLSLGGNELQRFQIGTVKAPHIESVGRPLSSLSLVATLLASVSLGLLISLLPAHVDGTTTVSTLLSELGVESLALGASICLYIALVWPATRVKEPPIIQGYLEEKRIFYLPQD